MTTFSLEHLQAIDDLMSRFNALQESPPHQLESINNTLSQMQRDNTRARETLENNVLSLIEQTQNQLTAAQNEIYAFINDKLVFKTELRELRAGSSSSAPAEHQPTVTTNNATSSTIVPKRIKLAAPDKFYGNKAGHCERFFAQLSLCFAANPADYPDDRSKIIYAISNLGGDPFKHMSPYISLLRVKLRKIDPKLFSHIKNFKRISP